MLRDRGYPGSAVQVRRYVRTVRPTARTEAYLRLETLAAEQGQVDWGNFGAIQIGHARRVLSCFVLLLSWSRAVYARFVSPVSAPAAADRQLRRSREVDHLRSAGVTQARNSLGRVDQERDREQNAVVDRYSRDLDHT